MTDPEIIICKDEEEMAGFIHTLLLTFTETRSYSIALAGGNTPGNIYTILASKTSNPVSWNKMKFFWSDERCVPPTHSESNYRMAKLSLLDKIPVRPEHIHRIMGERDPYSECKRYEQIILNQNGGVFDLMLLGLGKDGHTASIFPDQMQLLYLNKACDVARHPQSGQYRITLTGKTINASGNILFVITGKEKSNVVKEILTRSGNWEQYPASYIQPVNGRLIWLMDEEAGAGL